MKYKAEDGTEIISEKGKEVRYSCETNYSNGIYESEETDGSIEFPFIRQIKIKRIISDGMCEYIITESTTEELNAYLEKIRVDNLNTN